MTQHFTEHGRFIHVITEGPLKPFDPWAMYQEFAAVAGIAAVPLPKPPQPELQPLAPSPWSPVAPDDNGMYWNWTGNHASYPTLVEIRPSEHWRHSLGGFWARAYSNFPPDTGYISPDRFPETLATCCEKLEQQCRILRCGRFEETAAVIEGVAATLKAAYAAKGGK